MHTNRKPHSTPRLVVLSGRKASGKDTLAPAVMSAFGHDNPTYLSFADPLKDEVDLFIQACREAASRDEASQKIAALDGVDPMTSAERSTLVDILYDTSQDPAEHARSHSVNAVRALQYYGTEVRRTADPNYWVEKARTSARKALARGSACVFTDARFPNEVTGLKQEGAFTIRLEVSPEVQKERLLGRDGHIPTQYTLGHSSETALDGFTGFDVIVDTSHRTPEEIVDEILK